MLIGGALNYVGLEDRTQVGNSNAEYHKGQCYKQEVENNNVKWSAMKIFRQATLYGLNRIYLGIYMHIHINIVRQWKLVKKEAMNVKESRGL